MRRLSILFVVILELFIIVFSSCNFAQSNNCALEYDTDSIQLIFRKVIYGKRIFPKDFSEDEILNIKKKDGIWYLFLSGDSLYIMDNSNILSDLEIPLCFSDSTRNDIYEFFPNNKWEIVSDEEMYGEGEEGPYQASLSSGLDSMWYLAPSYGEPYELRGVELNSDQFKCGEFYVGNKITEIPYLTENIPNSLLSNLSKIIFIQPSDLYADFWKERFGFVPEHHNWGYSFDILISVEQKQIKRIVIGIDK